MLDIWTIITLRATCCAGAYNSNITRLLAAMISRETKRGHLEWIQFEECDVLFEFLGTYRDVFLSGVLYFEFFDWKGSFICILIILYA